MKVRVSIDLVLLDGMKTFRLGDYLDYTKNIKNPKLEYWTTLKKWNKGARGSDKRINILFNAYKQNSKNEGDLEDLQDFVEKFETLDKIPLEQFIYFENTVWEKIFDSAIEARKKIGDTIKTLHIEHDPKVFLKSCSAGGGLSEPKKFDIDGYIENLNAWLLYQKLGKVSFSECDTSKYFLSIGV